MQWWCVATAEAWTWEWRAYPGVWIFVATLAFLYWHLIFRRHGGRRGAFIAGLLLVWIALDWPVGALGAGYLASVHMVQFLLIAMIAPPFLLMGIPEATFLRWIQGGGRLLGLITHPLSTLAAFTVLVALTHWPPVVDALMSTQIGNFFLDGMWIATGLLFWWPVVAPAPKRPWLGAPVKMGYLIAATLLNTGVFIYLTFSDLPLYATFELAPPVGLSTRNDQVVAGLLMKMGGAVILWTAITILFFRWYRQEEGRRVGSAVFAALILTGCAPGDGDMRSSAVADGIGVFDVVVTEPLTGERSALYLTLRDIGDEGDTLLGVEVQGVGHASLHRTEAASGDHAEMGSMSMMPVDSLAVAPGGEVRLRPGGFHGMLEELEEGWPPETLVPVTLHFRLAGRVEVEARVVEYADLDRLFPPSNHDG